MARKSFLGRIDNNGAINGTSGSAQDTEKFLKSMNKYCKVAILTLLDLVGIKPKGLTARHKSRKHKKGKFLHF